MSVIFSFIQIILFLLQWAIIIRVLMSWMPMVGVQIDPYNPVVKFINDITDPILEPIRRFTTVGMIDLSPIVALIAISIIARAIPIY